MTNLSDWNDSKPVAEISLEQMDNAVKTLRELKDVYKAESAKVKELHNAYKEQEARVISLLAQAGKTKYVVEGVGQVITTESLYVPTPKTPEQKQAFFNWLREELGEDGYYTYATVNSNSLNHLYKQKVEEYGERGEVLEIEGLEPPTSHVTLSLRKA